MNKLKLNIPLAGFCNSGLADIFIGQPTTVYQQAYEPGKLAVSPITFTH